MQGNPYGAVPEALKETRLTLRDLMTAHLENKVAEGRLGLEKAKADTELAMVGANIKRDEIASLRDAAKMKQDADQFGLGLLNRQNEFGVTTDLKKQDMEQTATAERNRNAIAQGHLSVDQARGKREAAASSKALRRLPLSEWLKISGTDARVAADLGLNNPNMLLYEDEAKEFYANNKGLVPHLEAKWAYKDMKEHEELLSNTPQTELPKLEKQYNATRDRFMNAKLKIDISNKGLSDSGAVALYRQRLEAGDTPEQAAEHVGKLKTTLKEIKESGDVLRDDPDSFKVKVIKHRVDPLYDKRSDEAVKTILQLADKKLAAGITAGYKDLVQKKDFRGAYDYLRGYAYQLEQQRAGVIPQPGEPDFDSKANF
jgi:hypothetical protein